MLEKIVIIAAFVALFVLLTYLDKKLNLGLTGDMNCETGSQGPKENSTQKENSALRERIEVLERIVTEPKYQLNQEISKL